MEPINTAKGNYKYYFQIGLLLFAVLVTALSVYLLLHSVLTSRENTSQSVLQSEILIAEVIAEKRFGETGSYKGVCESVLPVVTTAEEFECDDGQDAWSIKAGNSEGSWCVSNEMGVKACQ